MLAKVRSKVSLIAVDWILCPYRSSPATKQPNHSMQMRDGKLWEELRHLPAVPPSQIQATLFKANVLNSVNCKYAIGTPQMTVAEHT